MGRWAQRRIRGGGYAPSPSCNVILGVNVIDATTANVTFGLPQDVADFNGVGMHDTNSGANGDGAASQVSANVIQIEFDDNISIGHGWSYDGTDPGVCTPQSGTMS